MAYKPEDLFKSPMHGSEENVRVNVSCSSRSVTSESSIFLVGLELIHILNNCHGSHENAPIIGLLVI